VPAVALSRVGARVLESGPGGKDHVNRLGFPGARQAIKITRRQRTTTSAT